MDGGARRRNYELALRNVGDAPAALTLKCELKLEAAVDDVVFNFNTPYRSFMQSVLD